MGAEIPPRAVRFGTAELTRNPWRPATWTLTVDGVAQSHVDVDDPTYLRAAYLSWIAELSDLHWPSSEPIDSVHVGGGALALPRRLAATRPGSAQTVFELDGELVEYVREHLLPDGVPGVSVEVRDGRAGVEALPARSADLVVLDVFRGGAVATELATVEFLREVDRVLRPGGLFAANLWGMEFALRAVASVRTVFPHVLAVAEAGMLLKQREDNLVVAASARAITPLTADRVHCLSAAQLETVCGAADPLTDAAPFDGTTHEVRRGWGSA